MKAACRIVGAIVLAVYLLSCLDVIDLYVCVGKRGSCIPNESIKPEVV